MGGRNMNIYKIHQNGYIRISHLLTLVLILIMILQNGFAQFIKINVTKCPLEKLPTLENGNYILSSDNMSALYYCKEDYFFDNLVSSRRPTQILFCNHDGQWYGTVEECIKTPCKPNPCMNGGRCSTAENPFGTGYTCYCDALHGGRRCQVVDPCSTCPVGTTCVVTYAEDSGRFCYDRDMNLVS